MDVDVHVLAASAHRMGFEGWDQVTTLTGGRGQAAVTWRQDRSYVVKAYDPDRGLQGVREQAALHVLGGEAGAPRLLAESSDPPYVVMTHLPGSGSLADALLGTDPSAAEAALQRWVDALGELHAASTPATHAAFRGALELRAPDLDARTLPRDFAAAADGYAAVLDELGLPPHHDALHELRELPSFLTDPRWEVLSPADTCPDNNVVVAGRMHLLDFEYAELRHAAWDVAYLKAPWPSCWCAWRLPEATVDAAVARYIDAGVGSDFEAQFRADLALATLGWQLMTPAFFVPGALENDDRDRGTRRPSRRAFILHRLAEAATTEQSPRLAALARDLNAALQLHWGDLALELAPAFRN